MNNRGGFTKGLAAAGTVLVFLPLLAPLFFGIIRLVQAGIFQVDYLMPAELLPLVLIGGGLLIWAAARARLRLKWVVWSLSAAIGLLVLCQVAAVLTGLADGRTEAAGLPWMLVLGLLIGYIVAVGFLCAGGSLLLYDLFAPASRSPAET